MGGEQEAPADRDDLRREGEVACPVCLPASELGSGAKQAQRPAREQVLPPLPSAICQIDLLEHLGGRGIKSRVMRLLGLWAARPAIPDPGLHDEPFETAP